ncbi:hypothetical protein [Streptomyces sp. NPDC048357]|uniref:hypothetical protein n=1 Tax=Streptomyces sp. NPDC048357 TaxID=3154719 RepID=UPI003428D525
MRIDMLGPLRIIGGTGSTNAHTPRAIAIAALIHLRPGRNAEYLCRAMDPTSLSELRNEIGLSNHGSPLLPRPKNGAGYTFHRDVTSDWDHFQHPAAWPPDLKKESPTWRARSRWYGASRSTAGACRGQTR